MKQGLHIMLQRFVRSMVSTAPRPYLMLEVPWRWSSSSPTVLKSRPGNRLSMRRENSASIEMRSSKVPCSAQVFRTRIWLSSS